MFSATNQNPLGQIASADLFTAGHHFIAAALSKKGVAHKSFPVNGR